MQEQTACLSGKAITVIGLMSGTSADGIDGSIIRTDGHQVTTLPERVCVPYHQEVQKAIIAARTHPASFLADPHRLEALSQAISRNHAEAVNKLLSMAKTQVDLIGFHGQTVYHDPAARRTIQLGDGNLLARLCHIPVIYDFRAADMEAGGQGAPLAPIYHAILLQQANISPPACLVNIGGVANLTAVGDNQTDTDWLEGFDTGPGNGLIDELAQRHFGLAYDKGGEIAATGQIHDGLVEKMMALPYFKRSGPRSLDRASFNEIQDWPEFETISAHDQIATVTAFTAASICHAIAQLKQKPKTVIIAGGGVHNRMLFQLINKRLPAEIKLCSAEEIGADSDNIEAELIGLLAARYHFGLPASFPSTTGAAFPQICGRKSIPI